MALQGIVSHVSTRTHANIQKMYNALSIRRSLSTYRSCANTSRGRGRCSCTNENVPARDRYGRLIPKKFGNIVLSGDSDIENCNGEMSKTKEKQIVTPFQDQNSEPLTISASSSVSPVTSLLRNSNEDKHMHRVNKRCGYSEYGNDMYNIIIEDPLEDKQRPPQYMMPFIQKVSTIQVTGRH